jgi:nucleoside-triphosphatase THEP1
MSSLHRIHPAWVNAALLGSVWASVEIVLGSFLHNIRMPMAGTFMAALGVCIVVAGSQVWNVKGLIWRAGVICALMKSVSPSAVILGPMFGIFLEALLLEATVRLLGRNALGYITGGALATSLPIIQKIIGILFLYGIDAARLYVALYEFAARSLHIGSVGPVDIVLFLLLLTALLGIAAASLGILAGRRAIALETPAPHQPAPSAASSFAGRLSGQQYSLLLLCLHILMLPAGLLAISTLPAWSSALVIACYVTLTFLRYPRVRSKFFQARLWLEFAAVSLLAGLLLGEFTSQNPGWTWSGLTVGLQMTLRATLVITTFSSVSIELRNPSVLQWFLDRGLGQLSRAVETAFEALPAMTSALGEEKHFFRHPLDSVARLLATARDWLSSGTSTPGPQILLLTGPRGSGKTGFVLSLADALYLEQISVAGLASICVMEQGSRTGYDVRILTNGQQTPLCRIGAPDRGVNAGQFSFFPEAFDFGLDALQAGIQAPDMDLMILDELGPLELEGKGWAAVLQKMRESTAKVLLITVRPSLIEPAVSHWGFHPAAVWRAGTVNLPAAVGFIKGMIRPTESTAGA